MSLNVKLPLWVWFLISIALCYALWNPSGYSAADFIMSDAPPSHKGVVFMFLFAIVALYASEIWRNIKGVLVAVLLLAAVFWFAFDLGGSLKGIGWWGQIVLGVLLTIGFQGGRMYQWATGRVPVADDVTEHH